MDDLSGLNKYKDPTTGCHIFCWAEVLGPCHFPECYFGKKGGNPVWADYSDMYAEQVVQGAGGCGPDGGNACLRQQES